MTYGIRNTQRLQAVLRDRFGLVLRTETRELPIYNLTQAKSGAQASAARSGGNAASIRVKRPPDYGHQRKCRDAGEDAVGDIWPSRS